MTEHVIIRTLQIIGAGIWLALAVWFLVSLLGGL